MDRWCVEKFNVLAPAISHGGVLGAGLSCGGGTEGFIINKWRLFCSAGRVFFPARETLFFDQQQLARTFIFFRFFTIPVPEPSFSFEF